MPSPQSSPAGGRGRGSGEAEAKYLNYIDLPHSQLLLISSYLIVARVASLSYAWESSRFKLPVDSSKVLCFHDDIYDRQEFAYAGCDDGYLEGFNRIDQTFRLFHPEGGAALQYPVVLTLIGFI